MDHAPVPVEDAFGICRILNGRVYCRQRGNKTEDKWHYAALNGLLQHINSYLVYWARRKYRRLRTYKKARRWWDGLTARQPRLFTHWAWMTEFQNSL